MARPGRLAYTNAFTVFNGDFTKVITALNNLGEKLKAVGMNYSVVEEANQTSANKISGMPERLTRALRAPDGAAARGVSSRHQGETDNGWRLRSSSTSTR